MTQGELPDIFGADWRPEHALSFTQPLDLSTAKSEVLRFIGQRYDAHLFLVANVWDHLTADLNEPFDGETWHAFSERFVDGLKRGMTAQAERTLGRSIDDEVIPRRSMRLMLERRRTHFLLDMRLTLRRLAHYMSIELDQRLEWQRMMTRTRSLDTALKAIFTEGMLTPDGQRLDRKSVV